MPSSAHLTLTANTVATVTLDADYNHVEVTSRDGAAEVYFTSDGSTPTVGGAGTIVLPATIGSVEVNPATTPTSVIKLISTGAPQVSVWGW